MRVLFVNENIGGHATVHYNLERALSQEHPRVRADFYHLPSPRLGRRLAGGSVPGLRRLDLDLQSLRFQMAQSAHVRRRIRRQVSDYDALHFYTHNVALLSVPLLRSRPSVVSLDTTNALNAYRLAYRQPTKWTGRHLPLTKLFERRVYEAADLIVSHSEWAARSLRDDYGVPGDRIRIIPFGVPLPELGAAPVPHAAGALPRATFIGAQMARKGGWRLLDLWRRGLRSRCTLTLVTRDEVPAEEGLEVINDIRPGDSRIWDVLRTSAVFVFPSEIDQAPNAVLEAMAAGTPVVAFRTAAVPEMVADGLTGLLVDEGDYDALALALEGLLDAPARRSEMGAEARARAVARFDVRVTTAQLVAALDEAVERHPRRRA